MRGGEPDDPGNHGVGETAKHVNAGIRRGQGDALMSVFDPVGRSFRKRRPQSTAWFATKESAKTSGDPASVAEVRRHDT